MKVKIFQEKTGQYKTVPETDTGGWIENIKALERMMLKELGNLLS